MFRLFSVAFPLVLSLCGLAAPSQAAHISLNPTFNISDQSIWGTKAPTDISYFQLLTRLKPNPPSTKPYRNFSLTADLGVGKVAFKPFIEMDHMLWARGSMNAGSLDATLPFDIELSFDESTIATDRRISFDSRFALNPNASFSTTSSLPNVELRNQWLYGVGYELEVCALGLCSETPVSKISESIFPNPVTLFNVDAGSIDAGILKNPPSGIYDSLTLTDELNVKGSVAGNSVSGSDSAYPVRLENLRPLKLVPKVGLASTGSISEELYLGTKEVNAGKVTIGVDYTLLSLDVDLYAQTVQSFILTPETLEIWLDFGNGFIASFLAGESATVDVPEWWTPESGFIPTIILNSWLLNQTDILFGINADLALPSVNIRGLDCCGSLGSQRLFSDVFARNLFNQPFKLQQQIYTGERIRFSSATSVPEPSVLFLFGSGVLGLLLARRARR